MSINVKYPESRTSYRYYYQHGGMDTPTDGEARGFDEEWQALQYMDENREHAQAAANESGDVGVIQVVDTHSFGKEAVVAIEFLRPIAAPTRPAFDRTDRPTLGDIVVSAAKQVKRGGAQ